MSDSFYNLQPNAAPEQQPYVVERNDMLPDTLRGINQLLEGCAIAALNHRGAPWNEHLQVLYRIAYSKLTKEQRDDCIELRKTIGEELQRLRNSPMDINRDMSVLLYETLEQFELNIRDALKEYIFGENK